MHIVKKYPDGIFAWVDLSAVDAAGAKAFYSGLFDWEMRDMPLPDGSFYTNAYLDGHTVAGMGEMSEDMKAQIGRAFWTAYIKHDDAEAVAAKVSAAGGQVMMPPMDVMEEGRLAVFVDPTGASFGVWQPKRHTGAQVVNSPNSLVWTELQTHDTAKAGEFYESVFGWSHSVDDTGYVAYLLDDRAHAGGMAIDPSWGEVPPNWSVYFLVDDIDAAVERVRALGGSVMNGPIEAGQMGRMAVVGDPQGGVFNLIQYAQPADVPPGV